MDQVQDSSKNIHYEILSQHGRDALKILRQAESTGKKIESWRNHRMFNLRCLRSNVFPTSIRLFSHVKGKAAENVLNKAEKNLLEIRIRQCIFTIKKLSIEFENLETQLYTKITGNLQLRIREFLTKTKGKHFETVKNRQRSKFEKLTAKKELSAAAETQAKNNIQERWVYNKSSKTFNATTTNLLRRGLNFAITPQSIPVEEIVTSTELACRNLDAETAASLRSEVARSVKRRKTLKPNVPKEEIRALQDLKKDRDIMVLPADKGKATVILDKKDYNSKIEAILNDTKTYQPLKKDPTTSIKNKLINILKPWKKDGSVSKPLCRQLYPTTDQAPKFYGLPKIHKPDMPLRPIVSGIGSVTEGCAKHLSKVLNAVKGNNGHAIRNSIDFVKKVQDLEVTPGLKMVSFDVSALFTSIPIDLALKAIKSKLERDTGWETLTELSLDRVLILLELCLSSTYFVYDGKFFKQLFGAPMGSPISPGVADLTMEVFEEEMLLACPKHLLPRVWYRYVDDTFTILHEYAVDDFTGFLNSRNPHIQFTRETEENDTIPFLDVKVHLVDDGSLKTTVYRKPTHTDQYLNWESNHHLDHKRSVVRTLLDRAVTHVSDPVDREAEVTHVREVLKANGYQDWALNVPNQQDKAQRELRRQQQTTQQANPAPSIGLPYVQGLSEELQRLCKQHGVNVYHKPVNTIRSLLVHPKDKTDKKDKCGSIYNVPCSTCDDFYVGETVRALGTRFAEHVKSDKQSAVLEHLKATGHSFSFDDVSILAREPNYHARKIKEALKIHLNKPTLNKDQGLEIAPVMLQLLTSTHGHPNTTGRGSVSTTRSRANSL